LVDDFNEVFIDKLKGKVEIGYVLQELDMIPAGYAVPADRKKPWGTGHAVLMAADAISTPFAAINADDFYGRGAFEGMTAFFKATANDSYAWAMAGYMLGNTLSEFGHVARGVCETDTQGLLTGITERTKIIRSPSGISYQDEHGQEILLAENKPVSMNFWGFKPVIFDLLKEGFLAFIREHGNNPTSEYYLPLLINNLIRDQKITLKVVPCHDKWFGVTYREDKPKTEANIRKLIEEGVYPEGLWKW